MNCAQSIDLLLAVVGKCSQTQADRLGIQRIDDPHHPRGYRELRSPAEMRKLQNRKIREQGGICAICHEDFKDYNDVVPDHKCGFKHIFAGFTA